VTVAEMLAEFHAAVSHPETNALWTRTTLHEEEHAELIEALRALAEDEQRHFMEPWRIADLEAAARELADVVYVAYGTAHALGIDLEAALAEVHRANMSKADGPRRADGKVLKPEGFIPPDMGAAVGRRRRGEA
jgi:predicted HAD superfamily Cof-like phosphohydrolase